MAENDEELSQRPWQENLEGLALAIIMALTLKYFVIEAYKIPTGSMQPTLMGIDQKDLKIFDRILVDKLTYKIREPRRWEVIVFRFPLDLSKNYIKRLIGLPGESIRIHQGDIYARQPDEDTFKILRKPKEIQDSLWRQVFTAQPMEKGVAPPASHWDKEGGPWKFIGSEYVAGGPGKLQFRKIVQDEYGDGYPEKIREIVEQSPNRKSGLHALGDLRLSTVVKPNHNCSEVRGTISQNDEEYSFVLSGPAGNGRAYLYFNGEEVGATQAILRAAQNTPIRFYQVDRTMVLEMNDDIILTSDLPADVTRYRNLNRNSVELGIQGGGGTFADTTIDRDIYYTQTGTRYEWDIPEGHFFFMGDNTKNSYDSRLWKSWLYSINPALAPGVPPELRGDAGATDLNPKRIPMPGDSSYLSFDDIYGERYIFPAGAYLDRRKLDSPLVPREYLLGKAIFVFWPVPPFSPVTRWQGVR